MAALVAVLLVPWLLVCVIFWKSAPRGEAKPSARAALPVKGVIEGKHGPWGRLQYIHVATEMPDEFAFILNEETDPQGWFFKDFTIEQATEFLKSSGLSAGSLESLAKPDRWAVVEGGCRVKPTSEVVVGMDSATRGRIYLHLAKFTENRAQRAAFSFYPGRLNERLIGSGLSEKSIALFNKFTYKQGPFLLYSDLGYTLPLLPDDDERRRFIKMISRKTTLVANLIINRNTDIEKLVGYWGGGGRAKDLRPLLESMASLGGESRLDIIHLLPGFARSRLYTYPVVSANAARAIQDCNWSSMNFRNFVPDDRFSNSDYLLEKLSENYFQISYPSQMGDLVFLVLPSGESIHSAVYIADNIVFTKNGESVSQPWLLMKMEDVIELYSAPFPSDEPVKPLYYRHKEM